MEALVASVTMIVFVVGGTLGMVAHLNSSHTVAPRASSSLLEAVSAAGSAVPQRATFMPGPVLSPTATALPRAAKLPTAAASAPEYALVMPEPTRGVVSAATASGATRRTGCDPAYPEERTCIPPGPPFDQGCAITDQRRFEVLPPDPQGLDHDGDGIGCEPIGASS